MYSSTDAPQTLLGCHDLMLYKQIPAGSSCSISKQGVLTKPEVILET